MSLLTHAQAQRALYVDFEGNEGRPPSFLGILPADASWFRQVVLEPELKPCASGHPRGLHRSYGAFARTIGSQRGFAPLSQVIRDLVALCQREDRVLVSWSSHEVRVVESHADAAAAEQFAASWRDGKAPAKRWLRQHHPEVQFRRGPDHEPAHRLDRYLRLIDYRVPGYCEKGTAAQFITDVREQLAGRDGNYSRLTARTKAKWTKVLDYNWHDCNGLREVVLRATREMEPTT